MWVRTLLKILSLLFSDMESPLICLRSEAGTKVFEKRRSKMANVKGFWSYAQKDDEQTIGKRITELRKQIEDKYELQTGGEKLELFQDKKDEGGILWGENWKERISEELNKAVFFIAIITPRYFKKENCRKELRRFSSAATEEGLEELILPIIYVDVEELQQDSEDIEDELIKLVKEHQFKDWTDQRLKDQDSEDYRKGVNDLASRLVDIVNEVSEIPTKTKEETAKETLELSEEKLEKPGHLERLAKFQGNMQDWLGTIKSITSDIEKLGEIGEKYDQKIRQLDTKERTNVSNTSASPKNGK